MSVYRIDYSGSLGKLERTRQGGVRVPATIARVGVLEYGDGKGGVIREYNPPEVLQAALDSLRDAPVTNEHPPELVRTDNFRKYAAGFVSSGLEFRDEMIRATLAIQDADLIADIERGVRREISAGYQAHVDHTPGVTPEGEPYDAIRTAIDFNHAAVVARGRAGSDVRLFLDSTGNVAIPGGERDVHVSSANATLTNNMTVKFKIDGVEHAPESAQAVFDAAIAKRDAAVSKAEGERDAEKARADAAESTLAELTAKLAEAESPARIDVAVTARLSLIEKARKVCGQTFDAAGKSESQIVAEVASKAHPKLDLKDKSEAYVRALFDAAVSAADSDPDGLKVLRGERADASAQAPAQTENKVSPKEAARAEMLESIYDAAKKNG